MINKTLPDGREKIIFSDRSEAFLFATKGFPLKHLFRRTWLELRAIIPATELSHPLSTTLPQPSLEQGQQMLAEEAERLERVLNSDVSELHKEIDADTVTIDALRMMSVGISQHLGETADSV